MSQNLSKFLSLVLRHKPELINLHIEDEGWCAVDELIANTNAYGKKINVHILQDLVNKDVKGRYEYNNNKTMIRACQGHSFDLQITYIEHIPPPVLYHGTGLREWESIKIQGLHAGSRQYVHLSASLETAKEVARRRSCPVVLAVDAEALFKLGYKFYLSSNHVWLCSTLPKDYINLYQEEAYENNQ